MLAIMVMVVVAFVQKVGVDFQCGVQVEAAQIKHLADGHLAKVHGLLRRTRVHVFQAVLQGIEFVSTHQIAFADEDLIGETHLAARFLAVIQGLRRVLGVHQCEDRVEQKTLGNFVIHEKGLRHRAGVGQAGGFNHHAFKVKLTFAFFLGQILQGGAQVFADGATHAAIAHLHNVFFGVGHQNLVVDVFFAKLVFNDGDFQTMRLGQHPLEQGGFAGT